MFHVPAVLELVWAAVALFGLGCGLGTWVHRQSRLPAWAWLPLVGAAACAVSYLLFFAYFFSPGAGRLAVRLSWVFSVGFFVWRCREKDTRDLLRQREVWVPVLLTVLLTGSYLASAMALPVTVNNRLWFGLPPDNFLPYIIAQHFSNGVYGLGVPPIELDNTYRSSDRPPLQAAVTLAAFAVHKGNRELYYQFVATICQMGWIATLYALGRVMGFPGRYRRMVLLAAAGSGFFYVNSIYTWPKLLSTWLFLFGLLLILFIVRERERERAGEAGRGVVSPWVLPIAAAAMALGLQAHAGVAFSVLALPWLAACWRPWRALSRPWRSAVGAVALAIALMAPWMAYQRFYDPPGDRLLKMHFAGVGVEQVDPRSFTQALADTYRALSWQAYAEGRLANLRLQWFGTFPIALESPIDWVQWQQFYRHVPLIGFLWAGYVLLFTRPARSGLADPDEPLRLTRELVWFAFITMAIWIVLMIATSSTLVHQGSYVMTTLLLFGGAAFVAALPSLIRWTVLGLHLALFVPCYLVSTRIALVPDGPPQPVLLAAALVCFALFAAGLTLLPAED